MSYFIAPDGDDIPTLWMETDRPSLPLVVASLYKGHLLFDDLTVAAILWHAGTAVLAPTDAQINAAARGLYEAEAGCGDAVPWTELPEPTQELYTSQARAMLAALRVAAEEAAA